jgi:hypothetical protein
VRSSEFRRCRLVAFAAFGGQLHFHTCGKATPGFWPPLSADQVWAFSAHELGYQLVSALVLFSSSVNCCGNIFSYRFLLSSLSVVVLQLDLFTDLVIELSIFSSFYHDFTVVFQSRV